jgi:hypothetical protein
LANQNYIKDNKLSVANYVKSLDKEGIVTGFKRVVFRINYSKLDSKSRFKAI